MWNPKPLILVAEDDENDAHLLRRTLRKIGVSTQVQIVEDGEVAIEYLSGSGQYSDRAKHPFPSVVVTDVKMPRKNGFDVLNWLKKHPDCAVIPVVVWTSSNQESDILKAYQLGANCYLQKPSNVSSWEDTLSLLFRFWDVCQKPTLALSSCAEAN